MATNPLIRFDSDVASHGWCNDFTICSVVITRYRRVEESYLKLPTAAGTDPLSVTVVAARRSPFVSHMRKQLEWLRERTTTYLVISFLVVRQRRRTICFPPKACSGMCSSSHIMIRTTWEYESPPKVRRWRRPVATHFALFMCFVLCPLCRHDAH